MSGRFKDSLGPRRPAYEQELAAFREALKGPAVSAPTTATELYELERLVRRYPEHARRLVDALEPPAPDAPDRPAG